MDTLSGLIVIALWLTAAAAEIFFLFVMAGMGYFWWFAIGLLIPPVGVIGGVIMAVMVL